MKKTLLVIAMSTVLAACGSSGSGTSGKVVDKPSQATGSAKNKPADTNKPTDTNKPADTNKPTDTNKLADTNKPTDISKPTENEKEVVGIANGNGFTDNKLIDIKGKDIKAITLKGRTFDLSEGYSEKTSNGRLFGISSGYQYMHFTMNDGHKFNKDQNESDLVLVVQGYATDVKDMPTEGRVTYSGKAYGMDTETDLTEGEVTIDVNFGQAKKTVHGEFTRWGDEKFTKGISFDAKIEGNKFKGTNVNGLFFGDKAAEIGGIYDDHIVGTEKGSMISFGAKIPKKP